jgi:hypothetical protein
MAHTLHGANTLVRLPGRSVTRRDDGLLELSCSYACRTASAATFRPLFDIGKKAPGETDFIITYGFSETDRGDGFTEFSITSTGAADPDDPNVLSKKGERSVQHFPSGLVRVDQTYVCQTTQESRFRQSLSEGFILPNDDGTPAIDGLYIFPAPNEVRNTDGFTEFKTSAYGRTNTNGQTTSTIEESNFTLISTSIFPPASSTTSQDLPCIIEVVTTESVAFNTSPISQIIPDSIPISVFVRSNGQIKKLEDVYKPGVTYRETGGTLGRVATKTEIEISPIVREAPGTQFGTFREVIFEFTAEVVVRITEYQA